MSDIGFDFLPYLKSFRNSDITDLLLTVNRLKTFTNWPFDDIDGAECTSLELAKAGFYMTSNDNSAPSTQCVCCLKELTWDEGDIPLEEHLRKMPHCQIAKVISEKKEIDMTVRDAVSILAMREVSIAVNDQLNNDIDMINAALKYNDDFVKKTLKKF
uniref:Baculoviral IAP repeat-containing protein 2 n=1 Tax=Strongyloides stercoralis TaxID=6248 RepID=A0A0K0E8C1_STRER